MFKYPGHSLIASGVAALSVLAAPAWSAETLQYAPAEAWVTPETPAKPDNTYAGAPAQVLLQNVQVRFGADGTTSYYTEVAIRIQTAAGLQAAQSYLTWNPATDDAFVNKAQILRGSNVIDVIARGQTLTTVRREQNLERAMLDGYLTGVLQPEGLEVGDTFVFASTIRRKDPVFAGKGEYVLGGLSVMPLARQVVRTSWDAGRPIQWRQSEDLKGKVTKVNGVDTYIVERNKVTEAETQDDAPARFNARGFVTFTEFADWAEVSRLMAPLYARATALPAGSALHKEISTIRAASNDPRVQAAMALKLVQNQVRYVFVGTNLGGYIPADADTTWQRRFGDCKGKTALLVAILRELGIKAEAAAVNSGGGDGIDEQLPAIEMFDHVIVRAEIEGKVYWLDGTRLGDRDLDSIRPPHVRWALPMTTAGSKLEAVPMVPPDKPTEDVFMRLDASSGLDVPAQARVEKILRGDEGVQFNDAYQALPTGEREQALKSWWQENYKWIEPRKVTATFDPVTGEERLTMEGPANMAWKKSDDGKSWKYQADIISVGWSYGVERGKGPNKSAPVNIAFPVYMRTRQEIILPKKGKDFTVDGSAVEKTLGGAEFRRQVALKDGVLTVEASKRALVPEIPYKDAVAAAPVLMEMWKKDVFLVAPISYRKDYTKTSQAANAVTGSEEVRQWVVEGGQKLQQGKTDEALSLLNKAVAKEPENVFALMSRGAAFMARNNANAARADFEMAVKLDPTQWATLNGLATVYAMQNRFPEALDALGKAIEIYPNNIYGLQFRARIHARLKQFDKAREDADAVSDLDPDSMQALALRVDIAKEEKKRDEAEQILRDAVEARPDDAARKSMLADFLSGCANLDKAACEATQAKAVAEYDKMIAEAPTASLYGSRAWTRPDSERDKAVADLDAAIKLEDTVAWPLLSKARMLMKMKAYDQVPALLEQAKAVEPKSWDVRSVRADLYLKTGRKAEGLSELAAMKREVPRNAQVLNASCWSMATHNVELEAALADCEAGLKLVPVSAPTLDSRAFVKLRLGRFDDAIKDYDAALDIVPDLTASLYGRGLAKLGKGDKAGGEADLKAARAIWHRIDADFAEYGMKP